MYEHADQSWRARPRVMSSETMGSTARRIGQHCHEHGLHAAQVILHGGEPLLAGLDRLDHLARSLRACAPAGCDVRLGVQTNGVLLDEAFCELFLSHGIKVGISIDGDEAGNDRHRRYANGRSSHGEVLDAVRLISRPRYRPIFAGLLCTIDIENDPVETYEALRALDPPRVDFLLPHATWDRPPGRATPASTPYADWLMTIHERWRQERSPMRIRTFDAIDRLAAGGNSLSEAFGLDAADLVVIETDGAIEQPDSLKTAYDGAPATGLNVRDHRLSDAAAHPGVVARSSGLDGLCETCRRCPVVHLCGGGLYAHRYSSGNGFDNPSVYCADLLRLVDHLRTHPPVAGSPVVTHALSETQFDELAAGGGDAGTIDALVSAQRSLRRARVGAFVEACRSRGDRPATQVAWEALCELDEQAPDAAERVLNHPYVGIWSTTSSDDPTVATYLWGMVLATAAIAHIPWRSEVPLAGELFWLPTLGALRAPARGAGGTAAVVELDPSSCAITIAGSPVLTSTSGWEPARTVRVCDSTVVLDDLDPYRERIHAEPSPRLDVERSDGWADAVTRAGEVIVRDAPRLVPAVRRALTTITPLATSPTGASATDPRAFGAVGVACTGDPGDLTVALLDGIQHLKIAAVGDMFQLLDTTDRGHYPVGWSDDPQPLEGVLRGAYARLAVTEVWRRRADDAHGSTAVHATATFASLRDHTRAAIDTLLGSGSLTALGERWVEQMRWAWRCDASC